MSNPSKVDIFCSFPPPETADLCDNIWVNHKFLPSIPVKRIFVSDFMDNEGDQRCISGYNLSNSDAADLESLNIPLTVSGKDNLKAFESIVGVEQSKTTYVEEFPHEVSKQFFGVEYFNSTASMMLCLAIIKEFEEITLHGPVPSYSLSCLQSWVSYAKGLGIKINVKAIDLFNCSENPNNYNPFNQSNLLAIGRRYYEQVDAIDKEISELRLRKERYDHLAKTYAYMVTVLRDINAGRKVKFDPWHHVEHVVNFDYYNNDDD